MHYINTKPCTECAFIIPLEIYMFRFCLDFNTPDLGFKKQPYVCKAEDVFVYRHTATANEKGAAGCKAAKSAQQTGTGRQEHLPCAQ